MQKFCIERFNITSLTDVKSEHIIGLKSQNKFAALENLDDDMDINRPWERIAL
jgi:hypothetical protein